MKKLLFNARFDEDTFKSLEVAVELEDTSIAAVVRKAVENYLEELESRVHPLSLVDAVSLENATGIEARQLIENAATLCSRTKWRDVSGVYLLVNPETKQLYVGSSTEVNERLTHHKHSIKKQAHKNGSVKNWGLNDLVVILLEGLPQDKSASMREYLLKNEQRCIDKLRRNKEWSLVNEATAFDGFIEENLTLPPAQPKSGSHIPVSSPAQREAEPEEPEEPEDSTESFIDTFVLPVLREEASSSELLDAVNMAGEMKDEVVSFIQQYNSPWLTRLSSTGRFPAITNLLEGA